MKIGILITGHVPEALIGTHGDYDRFFTRFLDGYGFEFEAWAVVDGVFPGSIGDADGWLITGSRHGAYEGHDWIPPLEDFIRQVHAAQKPMVGICFGHQIIAQALGGHVEKFKGGWAIGPQDYELNGETVTVNAWHQDQVTQLPDGARVLASNDFCAYAALAIGERTLTYQPHPEFYDAYFNDLARERGPGVVPDDRLRPAIDAANQPNDNARIAETIARFFKQARVTA